MMATRREALLAGFGGQGIVLAGYILGKAATVYEGKEAALVQSYGPESRGGASKVEIVVSDELIDYPRVSDPEAMVIMAQEAYHAYAAKRSPHCLLIYDEDLVEPNEEREGMKRLAIPATRLAEQLGRKIVANIVMLGFLTAITGIVSPEAMRQSIATSVPRGTEELNLKAFETGYEYAQKFVRIEVNPS